MTYTLHGDPAIIVCLLAILGGLHILTGIENWLAERISIDLHPLWHVIPRRFKVRLCWDRPGAWVGFEDDGREGCILGIFDMDDSPGPIALVQPCDENDDPDLQRPEWVACSDVYPIPGHSFRETWNAMRGKENESA